MPQRGHSPLPKMESMGNSRLAMLEEEQVAAPDSNLDTEQISRVFGERLARASLPLKKDDAGSSLSKQDEETVERDSEKVPDTVCERIARERFRLPRHLADEGSFLDWMRKKTSPKRVIKGVADLLKQYSPPDGRDRTPFNPTKNVKKVFVGTSGNNQRVPRFPATLARLPGGLKSYLYWLPEDILGNVVRHVSSRPRSEKWQGHMDSYDVYSLLHSKTPLAAVTKRLLPALTTCTDCDLAFGLFRNGGFQFNDNRIVPKDERALVIVPRDMESRFLLYKVLVEMGPFLQELYIHFHFVSRFNILDYRQYFIHLKALHVVEFETDFTGAFDLTLLLQACRGKLRTLDIKGEFLPVKYISGISECCLGLEDLSLVYFTWQKALSSVWTSLGPTLQRMCLAWPRVIEGVGSMADSEFMSDDRAKLCDEISTSCVKLTYLELKRTVRLTESLIRIVGNFGSQLRIFECLNLTHVFQRETCKYCLRPARISEWMRLSCRTRHKLFALSAANFNRSDLR